MQAIILVPNKSQGTSFDHYSLLFASPFFLSFLNGN